MGYSSIRLKPTRRVKLSILVAVCLFVLTSLHNDDSVPVKPMINYNNNNNNDDDDDDDNKKNIIANSIGRPYHPEPPLKYPTNKLPQMGLNQNYYGFEEKYNNNNISNNNNIRNNGDVEGDDGGKGGRAMVAKEEDEQQAKGEGRKKESADKRKRYEYEVLGTNPEYQHRLSMAYNHCIKRPSSVATNIMVDKAKTSAMCVVPDTGSTYWTNVFRFLNNETGGDVYEKPADIPLVTTHHARKSPDYRLLAKTTMDRRYFSKISFLDETFRFMFVSHPLRRLFSVWVNKFLLPEFWFTDGPRVNGLLEFKPQDIKCPTNITFGQFLRYVTHSSNRKRSSFANKHWRSLAHLCDPCVFHPHFIGKVETFHDDSQVALYMLNKDLYLKEKRNRMSRITERETMAPNGPYSSTSWPMSALNKSEAIWLSTPYAEDLAVHEMKMQTTYIFHLLTTRRFQKPMKECRLSKLFVAQRLWLAFQFRGYIRGNNGFPLKRWDLEDWHRALVRAYGLWAKDYPMRVKQQQRQRRRMLKEQCIRVPLETHLKIRDLFWSDFVQFGYDFEL